MSDYKKLGNKAFKTGKFDLAKTYFSLAIDDENKEEIMFLVSLCEVAKKSRDDANLLFDFYIFNIKEKRDFDNLNSLLLTIEEDTQDEQLNEVLTKEHAIGYEEFKQVVLRHKSFKEGLEGVMVSTKLIIKDRDNFLDFIENLLDNEMYEAGIQYFEMFIEIHGSWDEQIKVIAQKIKDYEARRWKYK